MNASNDIEEASSFSKSAALLTMAFNGKKLATGSGVVARDTDGTLFMATALHNLSGRRPGEDTPISTRGSLPNQLRIEGCHLRIEVNLYEGDNDPNTDKAVYSIHPKGSAIDVATFRIPSGTQVYYPLDSSFLIPRLNDQLPLRAGQTCYVLGFPDELIHRPVENALFPIWKTGHIASEPRFDFAGHPKLLIDCTTRRGMSGAMVVVSESGRNRLVGIYSGRYKQGTAADTHEDDPNFTTELGWVYRSDLIREIARR